MPITRSMTRALKAAADKDAADKAAFLKRVATEIDTITRPEQLFLRIRSITDHFSAVTVSKLILVINGTIERFLTRKLTINHPKGEIPFMGILVSVKQFCQRWLEKNSITGWIVPVLKKACLDFMVLFDYLFAWSTLTDPVVTQEQTRIMKERADAFVKSPYFLELGARLYSPTNFENGWFEDNGMMDEDGYLA
jgi:hypothetical protein